MGGHTPRDPDFLAHVLLPSALQLDLGNSVQRSNVGLCLYLHPLPDEGSMVICKIFISVAMGQDQVRHPLQLLPKEQSGTSPWTWKPL